MERHRKTVRLKNPNPLFETWLCEWIEEAKTNNNSIKKLQFENALESLRKYPIVLNSGKECLILEYFDQPLCIKLDRKLAEYRKNQPKGEVAFEEGSNNLCDNKSKKRSNHCNSEEKPVASKTNTLNKQLELIKKTDGSKQEKLYMPKYRSASYAILTTLLQFEEVLNKGKGMRKNEIEDYAQNFCDASFKKSDAGNFYTAWSSMSQLITRSLVRKQGKPLKFSLTDGGKELAKKLMAMYPYEGVDNIPQAMVSSSLTAFDIVAPGKRKKCKQPLSQGSESNLDYETQDEGPDYFLSNTFDIILLVDSCETSGKQNDETLKELKKCGLLFEVRKLKVGDFLWVARHKETSKELVLPYIVERKRMDDLAKSIKDGRFHDQKLRLKQCGLVGRIYLVEKCNHQKEHIGLPAATLQSAIVNTLVSDHFFIKMTKNHSDSVMYLNHLTKIFTNQFQSKTLFSCKKENLPDKLDLDDYVVSLCTFENFSYNIGKSQKISVKEMWLKQLVQLHGVSVDKAWAIAEAFPTPCSLMAALATGPSAISNLQYGNLNRSVGPIIAATLYSFYTETNFTT